MKFTKTLMAAAVGVAMVGAAHAAPTFDPGVVGIAPFAFDGLDWTQTSFVAKDGNLATGIGTGATFSVFTHASLANWQFNNNNLLNTGLGSDYEITFVAGFEETVTALAPGFPPGQTSAGFQATAQTGFFQMFIDTNINASALTGNGFNDGTLILSGQLTNSPTGSYALDLASILAPVALDQSGNGNDYDGQLTTTGSGTQGLIDIGVTDYDQSYFVGALITLLQLEFANLAPQNPFSTIDPSACYTTAAKGDAVGTSYATSDCQLVHVDGLFSDQDNTASTANGYLARIGAVNGSPVDGGPDFIAQVDPNSAVRFEQRIPEPGTIALVGAALIGLGAVRRRRQTA